jgi:hypothetical protein
MRVASPHLLGLHSEIRINRSGHVRARAHPSDRCPTLPGSASRATLLPPTVWASLYNTGDTFAYL